MSVVDRSSHNSGEWDLGAPPETLAELFALLSRCFETPEEAFIDAVRSGTFENELKSRLEALDVTVESMPSVEETTSFREAYRQTFESYEGPYAAPYESVYKEWHDGTKRGILSGPPAHDMERRYEALDADIPDAYPPDHLALLLEYASLLCEAGNQDAFEQFHDDHFDWIPEFHERVEQTCEEPFYRWAVDVLARVLEQFEHPPETTNTE